MNKTNEYQIVGSKLNSNELKSLSDQLSRFYFENKKELTQAEVNATIKTIDAIVQLSERQEEDWLDFCIVVDKPDEEETR